MKRTMIEAARELNDPKPTALVDRLTSDQVRIVGVTLAEIMADVPWVECSQPAHVYRPQTRMPMVPADWGLADDPGPS